jgi:hypothetical protein
VLTGQGHCEPGISTEKPSCTFCIQFIMYYQPVHVSSITWSSSGGAATRIGVELVSEFHSNSGSSQQT